MNRDRVISLADAPGCYAAITAFYNRYQRKIAEIETIQQRNDILSDMQQDFERQIQQEPQNRNGLSEAYQLLKQECWKVCLCGNE